MVLWYLSVAWAEMIMLEELRNFHMFGYNYANMHIGDQIVYMSILYSQSTSSAESLPLCQYIKRKESHRVMHGYPRIKATSGALQQQQGLPHQFPWKTHCPSAHASATAKHQQA